MSLGGQVEAVGTPQERVRGVGVTRRMPTAKPRNVISATAHNKSVVSAPKAMGEAGVRRCIWLKPIRTFSMSIRRRY
eukprot:2190845-Pyramimonas_sp.AAC.1